MKDHIDNMTFKLAKHGVELKEKVLPYVSWIDAPKKGVNTTYLTYDEYKDIYENVAFGKFWRYILYR